MNFREAIKRLSLVVAGLTAASAIAIGVATAPSRASISSTFLYAAAQTDAKEFDITTSEVLALYRKDLGRTDGEILKRICATAAKDQELNCAIYEAEYGAFWKALGMHIFLTLAAAVGVALAVLAAWRMLDWILAGLSVRAKPTT